MLKAILFDMDGVIIDSEPMHARAAALALEKFGVKVTTEYAYGFIGSTTYHMCQKMVEDFHLSATAEELHQANEEMKNYLIQTEGHEVVPYVLDLIKNLYDNGLKLIIASSSVSTAIEEVMESLHIKKYFHGFVSGNMVIHPKPAPDIFQMAAEKLGVSPSECLVIEDSYNGLTAATAAGITSIGYRNPNSGNQDLSQAAMLIEGFDEVDFSFLQKIYLTAHMEPRNILETDHLLLRELSGKDAEALCSLYHKLPLSTDLDFVCADPGAEADKLNAYMKNVYHFYGFGLWGVFKKETNQLIGRCGIEYKALHQEEIYELGYLLDPEDQGHGYAREFIGATLDYCFQELMIPEITALIAPSNARSRHLAESLGMRYCGECMRDGRHLLRYDIQNPVAI